MFQWIDGTIYRHTKHKRKNYAPLWDTLAHRRKHVQKYTTQQEERFSPYTGSHTYKQHKKKYGPSLWDTLAHAWNHKQTNWKRKICPFDI
jgi:hypothetical protein